MYVTHPLIKEGSIKLRRYQEAIVSRAIDANTLVVLPTGLGKTVVAAMVAAHRLYEFPESKILFLAPTRPLAVQHKNTFDKILKINESVILTGRDPIKKRAGLWRGGRMIFATPQTIENDMMRDLDVSEVSLIIFDECHRSVGNYAYVHIAKEYMRGARNPLILGLTASPSSEKETVKEVSGNLYIEQVEAKTEHDKDVKEYVKQIDTEWVKLQLPEEFMKIKKLMEDLLRDDLKKLKERDYLDSANIKKINKRTLLKIQSEVRKEITQGIDSYIAASITASAIKINHAVELLETQGIYALDAYLSRLQKQRSKAAKKLFSDSRMKSVVKTVHDLRVLGVDHPKLDKLVDIVRDSVGGRVLIFTQYRDSVEKIINRLNEADILAHEFVGQAARDGKRGMTQKEQIKTLEDFKDGRYTALVATSVAEEGIDIPKVDLVLFYEPVPSEIRSIQRRGRTGRTAAGRVVVLMTAGTRDEGYYWAAIHKERKMRSIVKEMSYGYEPCPDESQRMLSDFRFEKEKKVDAGGREAGGVEVRMYVDYRERNSSLLMELRERVELTFRQLPVGDFILSDRVVVERKTQEDFLSSLIDNRLFNQVAAMSENFDIPLLIIEGDGDLYSLRDMHVNAIRAAIASLTIDFGVGIMYSKDGVDTAGFLYQIARREQVDEGRGVRLRGGKKPLLLGERQRYVIESLPNVSSVLARRLLDKFGSVGGVVNASGEELRGVEGIGRKKAEGIRAVIEGGWGME